MKSTIIYKQIFIYILFIFSLILGFSLDENLSGGAIYDYNIHKKTIENLFSNNLINGLLNYDKFSNSHSPVFIIFLNFLISDNELIGRLIYLIVSSSIVIIFYKKLVLKYKTNLVSLFLLSNFFLLSPYFRSYSIWPGDETIALIFFCFSIYFCLKYTLSNENLTNLVLFNIITLAIASYFRPIYSIFSIFYFFTFFLNKNFDFRIFIIYVFFNILLAFPAFYYVFILEVNFFISYFESFNIINSICLVYLTIFFYLTPFIVLDFKNIFSKFNSTNFICTILAFIIVIFFFDYEIVSGGGFYLRLSKFLFNNDILIYILFPIAFYICNQVLELNKFRNILLFLLMILIEIDGHIYMESYDPLFYVLFFTLFDLKILKYLTVNLNKVISVIFIFQILLLLMKFYQLEVINTLKLI